MSKLWYIRLLLEERATIRTVFIATISSITRCYGRSLLRGIFTCIWIFRGPIHHLASDPHVGKLYFYQQRAPNPTHKYAPMRPSPQMFSLFESFFTPLASNLIYTGHRTSIRRVLSQKRCVTYSLACQSYCIIRKMSEPPPCLLLVAL